MLMLKPLLLCTDMDRTALPNGLQAESPAARPAFARLCQHERVQLCYVSGRSLDLALQAIAEYALPHPHFIIGDVGASLYRFINNAWVLDSDWQAMHEHAWRGVDSKQLAERIGLLAPLELQSADKQSTYKLSYQLKPASACQASVEFLRSQLSTQQIYYTLIDSIDETKDEALIDVLPPHVNKASAIQFLAARLGLDQHSTFFAGDSGNDIDALLSGVSATLVANASAEVRQTLLQGQAAASAGEARVYVAQGMSELPLNGHYSAGIVEGFLHYFPELISWVAEAIHE